MYIDELGHYGEYEFEDGERVKGWKYGELPEGILLSLDRDGRDIRLIRKRWTSWRSLESQPASFSVPPEASDQLWELNQSIRPKFEEAFQHLDFKPLQRFQAQSDKVRQYIFQLENLLTERFPQFVEDEQFRLIEQILYPTDEALDLHRDVLDELERVKILEIVAKAADQMPGIPPRHLIPLADGFNRREMERLEDDFKGWSENGLDIEHQRSLIGEISERRLFMALRSRTKIGAKKSKKEKEVSSKRRGDGLRYAGAVLRMLTGTGLAVGNIGLGLTGGLMSSLITMGATTIPVAVGVVASVGTGLAQVSDGLEKVGALQTEIASS